jgi:hypothetical protein
MNFTEIVKRIHQLNESSDNQSLADAVMAKINQQNPGAVSQHGMEVVGDAIADAVASGGNASADALAQAVMKKLNQPLDEQEDGLEFNPSDRVTLDIPLLLRIMEYSKEDAQTDMDLHFVVENMVKLSAGGKTLSMSDYDDIVNISQNNPQ